MMAQAIITRKGGGSGSGEATITFNNVSQGGTMDSNHTTAANLSQGRSNLAATSVGDYALFSGGYGSSPSNRLSTVDAYDTSLTRSTPTALSLGMYDLTATSIGNYALFGGGEDGGYRTTVDAYNTTLARTTPTNLSQAMMTPAATSVGNYALFGWGNNSYAVVNAYDTSLTRTTPTALSLGRAYLAATSIGDYALFGGGYSAFALVDAYYYTIKLSVFPGTKYKLNSMDSEVTSNSFQELIVNPPINGYIKIQNAELN